SHRPQHDPVSCTAVLNGIVNQVGKHLVDGVGVGQNVKGNGVLQQQLNSLRLGKLTEIVQSIFQQRIHGDGSQVQVALAGLHARQCQQVFRQARHARSVLADDFQKFS